MLEYFRHFPDLDSVFWTNYFTNEFIPQYNFYNDLKASKHAYVLYNNRNQFPGITKLSNQLSASYGFPKISYFLLFSHRVENQPIHTDGSNEVRYASLNLLLSGYENTKMIFYKEIKSDIQTTTTNAHYYFDQKLLTPIIELPASNEWVMINSGVPHHAVDMNPENPRMAICIRFEGNPKYEDLIGRL